nr:MAG TPA: minor tail protein [Myoviridae sp. ctict13]
MADAMFPELRGLSWDITKTPEFFTLSKISPSGVDITASLAAYPRWHFSLSYECLRAGAEGELEKLIGFFLACRGNASDFLYRDPGDHRVDRQVFGAGDGRTSVFQLCRTIGGFVEPIYDTARESIYVGDSLADGGYTIHGGIVAFATPPAVGQRLSWTGDFYYRCRFKESSIEFQNFAFKLWSAQTVEFATTKRVFM